MDSVAYDEGLQEELVAHALDAIKEYGRAEVSGCDNAARYNSVMWFALAHGLAYDLRDGKMILRLPDDD